MPIKRTPRVQSPKHARRSCLIVPGSQPRFLAKAGLTNADQVVFDLEDSVAPGAKADSRHRVVAALHDVAFAGKLTGVRVNACASPWCFEDIIAVMEGASGRIDSLVIPKVDGVEDVHFVDRLLTQIERKLELKTTVGLELQIETALGLQNVGVIAGASARTLGLILGPADLAASLHVPELTIGQLPNSASGYNDYVAVKILVAARAFGLFAIDGPYARVQDVDGLRASARRAAGLGFDGKWAIHPVQVDALNEEFAPRQEDIDRAAAIIDAYGDADEQNLGAVMLGDEMIDEASWKLAVAMVDKGRAIGMRARPSRRRSDHQPKADA
jgi:citrate lyase subunit beta / citryl-CoA lyase